MKTTFLSKENNDVKFTMDFTAEEFEAAVVKAYQASKNQFMIDGFRKGKAPRSIIEKHYGEGIFFEDAINNLFQESYPNAIRELELEVIDSPAAEFSEIGKGKPLTITITVPVYPVIEVKDYLGVEVEQEEVKVNAEDVDKEIAALQKRNARMVQAERPVQEGDTVILDYAGFVGDEQFEGGTAESQELKIGSGMFIPGFEEQLVGVNVGEKKDVVVTFPEEYHADSLAGKEAVFHCHVHEIKVEELPELDDEFAKDVSEYDTLDELKKATEERLQKNAEAMALNAAKDAIIEKVYEANKTDVPRVMVEDEIDRMAQDLDHQLRYQGLSLEQYLQFMGKDAAEFREELRADATKKVVTRLVLMSIVEAEKIEVSEEELEAELADMAKAYNTDVEKVREMIGVENITFFMKDIQLKKVIDMLYDKAEVKMVQPKAEDAPEAEVEEK
ncbi:trigger factor [Ihubacter sp. rT4E-8]|uniref:trigger factor n=1 Tax=unclassified Ihubacter TaxID=2633299 RepID=UPI003C7A6672